MVPYLLSYRADNMTFVFPVGPVFAPNLFDRKPVWACITYLFQLEWVKLHHGLKISWYGTTYVLLSKIRKYGEKF